MKKVLICILLALTLIMSIAPVYATDYEVPLSIVKGDAAE